jgi:hypothetical protein
MNLIELNGEMQRILDAGFQKVIQFTHVEQFDGEVPRETVRYRVLAPP